MRLVSAALWIEISVVHWFILSV